MKKDTDELMNILKTSPDINTYMSEQKDCMLTAGLAEYITALSVEKGIKLSEMARRAQMNLSYAYKLNEGVKTNPHRNKILQICFGFGLNTDESQRLLRVAGVGILYPRIRRDSIIIFCLEHNTGIMECEERLAAAGDEPIITEK